MKPRILYFDTETAPVRAWIWRVGNKIRISHEQIFDGDKFDIICICWKWAGEKKVYSLNWDIKKQDSSSMIETFTKVIESADIIIGHNGDNFDLKQINTQRLMHKQNPISWPTTEDTLKQFRRHFAFPSFKLDYLAKTLLGTGKDPMSFQDWIDIVQYKDPKALAKMIKYCAKDVRMLEGIFNRASKHFTPKAHMGLIIDNGRDSCPRCGSRESLSKGHRYLASAKYKRRQCKKCGTQYRGVKV